MLRRDGEAQPLERASVVEVRWVFDGWPGGEMHEIDWWRIGPLETCAAAHRGRPLTSGGDAPGPADLARVEGTPLWMEGNDGENELNLQRTLLLKENLPFLRRLAGLPEGWELVFAAREVGGAGSLDLAALFRRGEQRTLVLVDCKDAKSHGRAKLLEQAAQAYRLVLAAIPNLLIEPGLHPGEVKLVFLAGLSWGTALPAEILDMPRPGWEVGGRFTEIDPPVFHAYLPVKIAEGERAGEWLAVQRWGTSADGKGRAGATDLWTAGWAELARRANTRAARRAPEPGRFACVLVDAEVHLAALTGPAAGGAASGVRRLLDEGRRRSAPCPGWRYAGETNDKGFVRIWWEREGGTVEALRRYLSGAGLDPRRAELPADPEPGG